jgi:copper(I)-binding protein
MNARPHPFRLAVAAAGLALLQAAPAVAADITLKNAWMRPARAGYPTAGVYVEITTDVALKLVGASSPVAKSAGIVLVDRNPDDTLTDRPVKEVEIPGGRETRFALNGNRIELFEIKEDLPPGANVPLTLEFAETKGNARHAIEIGVLVRGVILPPPLAPGQSPADLPK